LVGIYNSPGLEIGQRRDRKVLLEGGEAALGSKEVRGGKPVVKPERKDHRRRDLERTYLFKISSLLWVRSAEESIRNKALYQRRGGTYLRERRAEEIDDRLPNMKEGKGKGVTVSPKNSPNLKLTNRSPNGKSRGVMAANERINRTSHKT